MKTCILYLHVAKSGYPEASPPEYYLPFSQRWVKTYRQFNAGAEHQVRVVCCGAPPDDSVTSLYGEIATAGYETYLGAGSDIGACQYAMQHVDADFVLCMSTPIYFWRSGWLKRLLDAREHFGDALYGAFASYQHSPHIRTSCWACSPKTFAEYPDLIDTREKCCTAEAHRNRAIHQISDWFAISKPVLLVTWSAVVAWQQWRSIDNIFRRGDQGNCLVWDQHCDVYFASHYYERKLLERAADFYEDNRPLPENPEKT